MTEQKSLVPKRRFKEFYNADAWEQRELGEITLKIGSGKTPKGGDSSYVSEGIPLLRSQNVYEDLVDLNDVAYITPQTDEEMKNSRVLKNDVLLNITGASIGRSAVYRLSNCANVNQHVCIIRPAKGYSSEFVQLNLASSKGQQQININQAGGAREGLNFQQIGKMRFMFPSPQEQDHIGSFFRNLDNLITLHHRKLEKTKALKSACLSEMFPTKGEREPKRRFAGFTDAWEQRELGEFYNFKNGLNKGKEFFGNGTPIVNFTDVFHNRGIEATQLRGKVELTDKEIRNFEVKQGDIFFTRTSETIEEIGYPSVMLDVPKDTVFSGFVLRGRVIDNDPLTNIFKKYVFFTDAFRTEMQKKSSMTTRALTSGTAIKEMCFNFPISKEEQDKIGQFFTNLDNLITLHQRKLEKLQSIKKAYLNEMFV